ncbi:MAG: hypothetical protein ACQESC_01845 [Nanobdellota archaeon]
MKQGQSEIIGLVIIVLIVSVALLIYITSKTEQAEENQGMGVHKKYAYNELSMSFLDALVDTSVCSVDVDTLIRDCGSLQRIQCGAGRQGSCQQLNDTITDILNDTLDKWGLSYGLTIDYPESSQDDFSFIVNNCTSEMTGRSAPGWIPIPLEPSGTAMVELGICSS